MKTNNPANVGKHAFEVAGLGLAPFRFVGLNENVITYPDGSTQAGGCCDYCSTGIRYECIVKSSDGKLFKVGSDCIRKVGDEGLFKAFKTSPEFRARQRKLRQAKATEARAKLVFLISEYADTLRALPHPRGFTDRETGQPLTALDQARWLLDNCGNSGIVTTLAWLTKTINAQENDRLERRRELVSAEFGFVSGNKQRS